MYRFVPLFLAASATATLLWDGRLNNYTSASFLSDWSWSNQAGPYQYYIHGSAALSEYVSLSQNFKNPFDSGSKQGLRITIDNTSSWNGQNMMRTELIPQTTAPINKGKVFYHFSLQHTNLNPPNEGEEHQVCFFESHFTEMKYGVSGASSALQWFAGSQSHWNTTFTAGVWHNVAYGIDFDAGSVTFYHSTGSKDLELTAGPISANTSSDGKDWHLGVLRLPGTGAEVTEDWHFSGVYVEDGTLTTWVSGPQSGNAKEFYSSLAAAIPDVTSSASTFADPADNATSCTSSALMTPLNSVDVAANPAPTFSPTASIIETYTPSSVPSWYAQTTGIAEETETPCGVVYATVTVTA